jgi:hypothetical protein
MQPTRDCAAPAPWGADGGKPAVAPRPGRGVNSSAMLRRETVPGAGQTQDGEAKPVLTASFPHLFIKLVSKLSQELERLLHASPSYSVVDNADTQDTLAL